MTTVNVAAVEEIVRRADLSPGSADYISWSQAYYELLRLISDYDPALPEEQQTYTPAAGVNLSVWQFVNAAARVNAGNDPRSELVREYTAIQASVRRGIPMDAALDGSIQQASNDIARSIFEDIIDNGGQLPTIADIEEHDAAGAAQFVFDGDRGGWSGAPLFITFSHDIAFKDYVLDTVRGRIDLGGNPVDPLDGQRGGYDIFAFGLAISHSAPSAIFNEQALVDYVRTISGNDLGFLGTVSLIYDNITATGSRISDLYGDRWGATDFFTASGVSFGSDLNTGGFIVGANIDKGDVLTSSGNMDFIHAGAGDDTIAAGNGIFWSDVIDGGVGADTVDYSLVANGVVIRSENYVIRAGVQTGDLEHRYTASVYQMDPIGLNFYSGWWSALLTP